ncbi:uncharacterized protein LOC110181238 [Drosophila serrata]|uniref:uncharacterized protein LOC110180401 n=1 Tax=Drosophila serrata TaxID=7274 RepID=UPI000A1D1DE1|nr:uncharacterized protein LOC110180401 [Drosophila serrata]XP_020804602.1 uncharacterized protein LOC110181238 [Drosophila serrata]
MSSIKNGQYYVLISSSNKSRKLLRVFPTLTTSRILTAAEEFGIFGRYLVSAEENVIIADALALHHYIQQGHTIMVVDTLDDHIVKYIKLEEIGESETDDEVTSSQAATDQQLLQLKLISSQLGDVKCSLNEFIHHFGPSTRDKMKSFQSSI